MKSRRSPFCLGVLAAAAALAPLPLVAEQSHNDDDAFWAQAAALLPGFTGTPAPPGPSNEDGSWSNVIAWPHVPVSAASLPDGRILTYSGQERRTWPGTATQTYTATWDPETNSYVEMLYDQHEMFCAHLVMRTDGVVQTMGGRYTVVDSSTFDFRTNNWGRVDNMNDPRWYTTSVALPDGDVFTLSGSGGPNTAERYDVANDQWNRLNGIDWQPVAGAAGFESNWWPYLWVAPDGRLFHFGPTETMHWVSVDGNGSRTSAGISVPGNHYPKHAGVAMYESGKILVAGGAATTAGGTTNLCYTVDLNTNPPTVQFTNSMAFPRRFHNAVVLPTGEVLVAGGNTSGQKFSDVGTVLTPEIWNPATGQWRPAADMAIPRNYHSVGLLMPDGRAFIGGGGYATGSANASYTHQDVQIYTPPALFNGSGQPATRPVIASAPDNVTAGAVFEVNATPGLHRFALIRTMATTHGLSTDQRHLGIPFSEVTPGNYQLVAHPNPNVIVPGYWMLFGLDASGVYSEAAILHVNETGHGPLSGLNAEYFDGMTLTNSRFSRIDHEVGFDWGFAGPNPDLLGNNTFSARWTGWVVPDFTETHTFYTNSDDGVRLWVGGQQLVDNWTDHVPTEDSGTIALTAGVPVPITLEYYENTGGALLQLSWSSASTPKQIVPEENLRHGNPNGTAAVAVDDIFELFIDGALVAIGTENDRAYHAAFQTGTKTTIAVRACDTGGGQFVVGDFLLNGQRIATDSNWKVFAGTTPPANWAQPGFDDSSWVSATDYGGIPSGVRGLPVDSSARQIWSASGSDGEIYLRRAVGGVQLTHPGTQTGFSGDSVSLAIAASGGQSPFTFSATGLPSSLSINPSSGVISGTPDDGDIGSHTVTVTVQDAASDTDQVSFDWTVLGQRLLDEDFSGGAGGFSYADDTFRGTNAPAYASGSVQSETIVVTLGGLDDADILGMSGGWSATLNLSQARNVHISFRYLLTQDPAYENDEISQALFSVDGTLAGLSGNGYLAQLAGGSPSTTGWQTANIDLGVLGAGAHTLTFGGWNSKKTETAEVTTARFDDILVTATNTPNSAPTLAGIPDQTHNAGQVISLQPSATDPENDPLAWSATGLPPTLGIDTNTGRISGAFTAAGSHAVTVSVDDGNGGNDSTGFTWTVNESLALQPMVAAPAQNGTPVNYTASSSGGTNPRYKWNFGDGTPETAYASSPNISHTFANPGIYRVTLTGTDDSAVEVSIDFIQNIHPALAASAPVSSQSVLYDAASDRVWNVNPDNDTVSVFDALTDAKLAEVSVGQDPRSLAIAADGHVWVVCKDASRIDRIHRTTFAPGSSIDFQAGSQPHGLAVDPQGQTAFLTLEAAGELVKLNASTGAETGRLDLGAHIRHLSITADGASVYVSRFVTPPVPGESAATPNTAGVGGEVLRVDAGNLTLAQTILLQDSDEPDSGGGGRGIPNYLGPAALSPAGDMAWVPSKQDNIHRGILRDGRDLNHENTVRAISSRIDLGSNAEDYLARIDHDDAAVPSSAVFGPLGLHVFTALEGSREVAVIDVYGEQELLRFDAGRAPQGLALSDDGNTLYVHNFMSRTVTAHDVSGLVQNGDTAIPAPTTYTAVASESLSATVLLGKRHFYDAVDNRLSLQDYMSCAACHNDGDHDGRVWDLTGFGEGLRNTIELRGRGGMAHGPLHWTGNFDEVQDFENQIRDLSGGTGLINGNPHPPTGTPNAGRSVDLDALAAYVASLDTFAPSPKRNPDTTLTPDAIAGRQIFIDQNCAQCHGGSAFTDSALNSFHDIGTLKPSSGNRLGGPLTGLDTPTLRGLLNGAPFLHDGSAATLGDAVSAHDSISLNAAELDRLVAYLEQIDPNEPTAPEPPSGGGDEIAPDANTVALYHFNTDYDDDSGNGHDLIPSAGVQLASDNLGWMQNPGGQVVRFDAVGEVLTVSIPDNAVLPGANPLTIEARIYPRAYLGYSVDNLPIVSLEQNWNASMLISDRKWGTNPTGPEGIASNAPLVTAQDWANAATLDAWHHLQLTFDGTGTVVCRLDGVEIGSSAVIPAIDRTDPWLVTLGNFSGDIDEVHITRSVPQTGPDTTPPSLSLSTSSSIVTGAFSVDATFSESVTGFALGDVAVANGAASGLSGSGDSYTFTVTPGAAGNVSISVPAGAADDATGNASTASNTLVATYDGSPPTGGGDEIAPTADTVALYHFNIGFNDDSGNGHHLTASGSVQLAADNLGWMQNPGGQVARFDAVGETLTVAIPDSQMLPGANPLTIEARIYPRAYLGYSIDNLPIVALEQNWNASMLVSDRKWGTNPQGPEGITSNASLVTAQDWANAVSLNTWHKLQLAFDGAGTVTCSVDDVEIGSSSVIPDIGRDDAWSVVLGNFDGDIDEVHIVRAVPVTGPDTTPPEVTLSASSSAVNAAFSVSAQFTENVAGFALGDIAVANGTASALTGSGANYGFTVTPIAHGNVGISIAADLAFDAAGNGNTASNVLNVTYDDSPPTGGDDEYVPDASTIALWHFNTGFTDASGNGHAMTPSGGVQLANDNLGWMRTPGGQAARFGAIGDTLTASIPDALIMPDSGAPVTIEARIYPRAYLGYGVDNVAIISLSQEWDTHYELRDQKWASNPSGPHVISADVPLATAQEWATNAPPNQWSLLQISFDGIDTVNAWINGTPMTSLLLPPNTGRTNAWAVTLGNFDGDIDEVIVHRNPAPIGGTGTGGLAAATVVTTPVSAVISEALAAAGLADTDPLADPDLDGWNSFAEIALGSDPAQPDEPGIQLVTDPASGKVGIAIPVPETGETTAHGYQSVAFRYTVEASTDLDGWSAPVMTEIANPSEVPAPPDGFRYLTLIPESEENRFFYRVFTETNL